MSLIPYLKQALIWGLTLSCLVCQANTYGGHSSRHHVVTISNALRLQDKSVVTIRGYITESKGPEIYEIKDTTGRINALISSDVWQELTVDSQTKIEVQGIISRDGSRVMIEADLVRLSR